jgi:hypothetical protein
MRFSQNLKTPLSRSLALKNSSRSYVVASQTARAKEVPVSIFPSCYLQGGWESKGSGGFDDRWLQGDGE